MAHTLFLLLSAACHSALSHPGSDEVALVQQSLAGKGQAALQEEALQESESERVLHTMSGLLHVLKFEHLLERDSQYVPPRGPKARPEFVLGNCTLPELRKINQSMNAFLDVATQQKHGMQQLQHVLPPTCGKVSRFNGDMNYTALKKCTMQALEISSTCASCHEALLRSVAGNSPIDNVCKRSCLPLPLHCDPNAKSPSTGCLSAMGKCLECSLPYVNKSRSCFGGMMNKEETMQAIYNLTGTVKKGQVPDNLVQELRKLVRPPN